MGWSSVRIRVESDGGFVMMLKVRVTLGLDIEVKVIIRKAKLNAHQTK